MSGTWRVPGSQWQQSSGCRVSRAACPPWCQLRGSPCTPGTAEALSTWHPGQLGGEGWWHPALGSLVGQAWRSWLCDVCLSFSQLHWKLLWRQRVSLSLLWPLGEELRIEIIGKCGLTGRDVAFVYSKLVCSLPGRCWDFLIKCAWHFISCSGGFVVPCSWGTNDVSKGRKLHQLDTGKSRLYCALQGKS